MSTTLLLPRLWINGNLPEALLIMNTTQMPLIRCSILMSYGGRTRDDETWSSRWIMAGKDRKVCHLPERVLRQYGYIQTVPRPPTDIGPLALGEVAMAFMEFALHVLSQ